MKTKQRSAKAKKSVSKQKIRQSPKLKRSEQSKKPAAETSEPWQPFDHDADIREQIEEEISQAISRFPDYFRDGEKTILQITEDLKERLLLLFYIASIDGALESKIDKLIPGAKDQAVDSMCAASDAINFYLIQLANKTNACAAERIWDNGIQIVSAIKTLAQTRPSLLKPKARKALYLPSFRSRAKKFSDDFYETADRIELSADFLVKTGINANYDLDTLVTKFMVKMLAEAEEKRKLMLGVASFLDEQYKDDKYPAGRTREQ
jgi:hypothetical protein